MENRTWVDRLIGIFSPRTERLRILERNLLKATDGLFKRKYEGAAGGDRRFSSWYAPSTSANAEISQSLTALRNRSRDLVRNNAYAARGISLIESNTVGTGIIAGIKSESSRIQRTAKERWSAWAETTACDFDGRLDLYGMQRLAMRSVAEGGEVFIRLRRLPSNTDAPLPIQLQLLEGDFLDSTRQRQKINDSDNSIIQGIEFDPQGKRIAYWFYKDHPGGFGTDSLLSAGLEKIRVPVDAAAHVARMDRPGQLRGVPWCAPVMVRLRDFDEFEDTQLVRQKIAACFTAFVHDIDGVQEQTTDEELGDKFEPGLIEHLGPGKTISFANPPSVQNYKEYTSSVLHAIAAGLGVTYEALTGDLEEVNFSSARMGWLEFQRNIETWRWHLLIPQMMVPITEWFKDSLELTTGIDSNRVNFLYTPPAREMIDPTKEVSANIEAIRGGIKTLSETIREQGRDPEQHFEEIQSDNNALDKLGLTLDTDPRKTSKRGDLQETVDASSGENSEDSEN